MAAAAMLYALRLLLLLLLSSTLIQSKIPSVSTSGPWRRGHVTFYDRTDISGSMGSAQGDGINTTSTALFNEPLSGGACFEIKCANDSQWCQPGSPTIIITATDFCHSNFSQLSDNDNGGGWRNSPRPHFELAMPMFLKIADYRASNVSIDFRRVSCETKGGMMFTINGLGDKNLVLISNVAGAGNIMNASVKGSNTDWLPMSRSCRNWQSIANLTGQALSFKVTGSDGKTSTSDNIAPADWKFGQSFVGNNF